MTVPAAAVPRREYGIGFALCLAVPVATPASAQDGWTCPARTSGWLAGLQADVATPFGTVRAEFDFGDV